MLIKSASRADIEYALHLANKAFDDNLTFKRFDWDGSRRGFQVTLTVKDSTKLGARRGFSFRQDGERRRLSAACWHAHGVFLDSLPKYSTIYTAGRTVHPGDPWGDWNAGSMYHPVMISELCDCTSDGRWSESPLRSGLTRILQSVLGS